LQLPVRIDESASLSSDCADEGCEVGPEMERTLCLRPIAADPQSEGRQLILYFP